MEKFRFFDLLRTRTKEKMSAFHLSFIQVIIYPILGFHVTLHHHKTPEMDTANSWFSSHNFGKVVVIQKFQYFQNYNGVLYGAAMLYDMPCHQFENGHYKLA